MTFRKSILVTLCLLLFVAATGCSSVAPRNVFVTLDPKLIDSPERDQIDVHVFAVSDADYRKYHLNEYSLTDYWKVNDPVALRFESARKALQLATNENVTDGVRIADKDYWANQEACSPGYAYLIVIANGPYDQPSSATTRPIDHDDWSMVLPLQTSCWDDGDDINITIQESGLKLKKQPKNWQTP